MTPKGGETLETYFELCHGIRKEYFIYNDKGEVTRKFARIHRQVREAFYFIYPKRVDGQPQYWWWWR